MERLEIEGFRYNRNRKRVPLKRSVLDELIIKHYNYDKFRKVTRSLYFEANPESDIETRQKKIAEVLSSSFGTYAHKEWPCAMGRLEDPITRLVREITSAENFMGTLTRNIIKWQNVALAYAIKKLMRTLSTDVIERIFIEECGDIIPTFMPRKKIDFFIDGIAYDEKTSRSVGKFFDIKYAREIAEEPDFARKNPKLVAEELYSQQGEERFGSESRIFLIVSPEKENNLNAIRKAISDYFRNGAQALKAEYIYKHRNIGEKEYTSLCHVIFV